MSTPWTPDAKPVPPAYDYPSPPWDAPPAPPARGGPGALVTLAVAFVVSAAAAFGVAVSVTHRSTSPTNASGASNGASSAQQSASLAASATRGVVNITAALTGRGVAKGSGMIITSSGEVLTNNHVIDGATSITVDTGGRTSYSAKVVGYSVSDDIALLRIQHASGLDTVDLGHASSVSVDQEVTAVGNARGGGGTPVMTSGIVTALHQTITASDRNGSNAETLDDMIQISGAIQPGDSGGPIVDNSGRVVGVTTAAQVSRFRASSALVAFAIPIDRAVSIAHTVESGTSTSTVHVGDRAMIGVELDPADAQSGALVVGVQTGSPAETAGLTAGDVVVSFAGKAVGSAAELESALNRAHPGDRVKIAWTDAAGTAHSANIKLVTGPPA